MRILVMLLVEPWQGILDRLDMLARSWGSGAILFVLAVLVMLVGWGIVAAISRLVRALLRSVRFNEAVGRVVGPGAAARHEPAAVAAWAVYWVGMAGVALLALETLGLSLGIQVEERLSEVVPRIATSAVLFAVGSVIAMMVGGVTRRFLQTADIRTARLQGQVVSAVLTGFAALLALEQLGFAATFVMALGIVAASTAGLGLALAFGLGCRDLARDFIVEYLRSLDDERSRRPE